MFGRYIDVEVSYVVEKRDVLAEGAECRHIENGSELRWARVNGWPCRPAAEHVSNLEPRHPRQDSADGVHNVPRANSGKELCQTQVFDVCS
jgi:hypothetical protein